MLGYSDSDWPKCMVTVVDGGQASQLLLQLESKQSTRMRSASGAAGCLLALI